MSNSKTALLGSVFVLLSAVLFAIKAILIKYAYGLDAHLDGTSLLALRMATALPFFLLIAYCAPKTSTTPNAHDWALLLLAGLVGYYLASILDFIGLQYVSASLERIILFLYPTLTVLMTAAIYRRPLERRTLAAIVMSYGGTLVVMLGEGWQALHGQGVLLGSALVFAGAVAYALYLVMSPTLIQRFGGWRFTGLAMSVACVASIVHFLWVSPQPMAQLAAFSPAVLWLGAALGIFSTVLPATLLMQGIERIGAAQAALISAGGPILTVLLAVAILGEHLNGLQWLGCALNMAGVLMITLAPKSKAAPTLQENIEP